ncbi:alpha/beta hydrolase [Streptomyces misionensis]|uniref:alpha/beta fold hydrolase n=1 Tax=Streptomyces misionensis TaxID=67331 RepID=UPI0033DD8C0A
MAKRTSSPLDAEGTHAGRLRRGSRITQALAQENAVLLGGLVLTPPLPGGGTRILGPQAQDEFWYQGMHRSRLVEDLLDGNPVAIRAHLAHFWSRWSGTGFAAPDHLDRIVEEYSQPGAVTASVAYYRAGSGTVAASLAEQSGEDEVAPIRVPTTILWPGDDPLFPSAWSDLLGEFFTEVLLEPVPAAGHFVPVEGPDVFARAVVARVRACRGAAAFSSGPARSSWTSRHPMRGFRKARARRG